MEFEQDYLELTVEREHFYMEMKRHGTFRNIMNMETTSEEIIQLILHYALKYICIRPTERSRSFKSSGP
jgi:uncharacterized protein YbcV (DUF1398 family)